MLLDRMSQNPITQLRNEMNRLWENFFDEDMGQRFRAWPPLNIWQDATNIYVEAELPGMKMQDVEVLVCNNELTIRGERKNTLDGKSSYHRRERNVGKFIRCVTLPVDVNADKVSARLSNGILTVELSKAEAAMPKKITVQCRHN